MSTNQITLRDVHLLELPIDLQARASQWHEDLMREFALIDMGGDGETSVPGQLLALVARLRGRYASFSELGQAQIEDARRRGEPAADVTYTVPAEVADAAEHFNDLLDQADRFCRSGDLLTLAAPPDLAAFRAWFLREFVVQLRGGEPTPWPRYRQQTVGDDPAS